jgi:ParB family chromosome partitioning protein
MSKRGAVRADDILGDMEAEAPAPAPAATPTSPPVLRTPAFQADRSATAAVANAQVAIKALQAELDSERSENQVNKGRIETLERDLARLKALEEQGAREGAEFLLIEPTVIADTMPRDRFEIAFTDSTFQELVESISNSGQIEPIVVREISRPDAPERRFEIITGRRRLRALSKLGWKALARVVQADDATALAMQYEENEARADIGALERGRWFRGYLQRLGCTQTELATRLRLKGGTVSQYIAMAGLPDEIISQIRDPRTISYNKGRRLLELLKDDTAYDRIIAALDERKRTREAGGSDTGPAEDVNVTIAAGEGKLLPSGNAEKGSHRLFVRGRKIGSMSNAGGRWNIRFTAAVDDAMAARLAEDLPKIIESYKRAEH